MYESAASAAAPPTHLCHLLLSAPVSGPAVGGKKKEPKYDDAKLLHSLAVYPQQKCFDF